MGKTEQIKSSPDKDDSLDTTGSGLAKRSNKSDFRQFAIYRTVRTDFDRIFSRIGQGIGNGNYENALIEYQDLDFSLK